MQTKNEIIYKRDQRIKKSNILRVQLKRKLKFLNEVESTTLSGNNLLTYTLLYSCNLLGITDTADIFNVSRQTIYQYITKPKDKYAAYTIKSNDIKLGYNLRYNIIDFLQDYNVVKYVDIVVGGQIE